MDGRGHGTVKGSQSAASDGMDRGENAVGLERIQRQWSHIRLCFSVPSLEADGRQKEQ
jgi:hypothetical protein